MTEKNASGICSLCHRWKFGQVHLHKQHLNPCAGHPPVYQDLSACHDWPVKQKQCQFASQVEGTCK